MARFFALLLLALSTSAQTPAGKRFEVVSIKPAPNPLELRAQGKRTPPPVNDAARYQIYTSMNNLIRTAYGIQVYQKVTGPDWADTSFYEIAATVPEGATRDDVPEMLRALLAERFQLAIRRQATDRAVYQLVVGKDGPKLKEAAGGDLTSERPFPNGAGGRILLVISNLGADGWQTYSMLNGATMFDAARITIPKLAAVLSRQVDAPVIDRTGLTSAYEISIPVLHGPNGLAAARGGLRGDGGTATQPQASDPSGADIFKSVEKLGLRLEKTKAPIDDFVVDHVEKVPTGN